MTRVYLETNPPAVPQYRAQRRAEPTGAIVVHTAENTPDLTLPDSGAEGVAAYIGRRTNAGSYHTVIDSDTIARVGRYEWEMFGEGTGGNRWALHLSFACRAAQWPTLPRRWFYGALQMGAIEAVAMAGWVKLTTGRTIPARRITAAQYRAGAAGFIGHGELDPGRRTDPGSDFPWDTFLDLFARFTDQEVIPMPTPTTPNPYRAEVNEALQLLTEHAGYTGELDGWFGPAALAALHSFKNRAEAVEGGAGQMAEELVAVAARAADLRAELDALRALPSVTLLQRTADELDAILHRLRDRTA